MFEGREMSRYSAEERERDKPREDEYEEVERPHVPTCPHAPTRQDILEHNLTHIPFRPWCPHCVRGQAKAALHYSQDPERTPGVPTIAFDYAAMGDKRKDERAAEEQLDTDDTATDKSKSVIQILVGKDTESKCVAAIPVPTKGLGMYDRAITQTLSFLDFLGYKQIIIRSDQEAALSSVIDKVRLFRGSDTQNLIEHSPVHDCKSNGFSERGVQQVEALIRTQTYALETRLMYNIMPNSCLLPWLAMHAGNLTTLYQKGKGMNDGKTPDQRLRGKNLDIGMYEFGENIHFMLPDALKRGAKLL